MPNYLQPIQPWVVKVLEEREKNPLLNIYKNPFVILSSGALVVRGDSKKITSTKFADRRDEILNLIAKPPENAYQGCIIANNINNIDLSYSLGETPVGIDFAGKVIKVSEKTETGRKVSTPIVTSIDVDTEEANNALKTTRVNVKCFTLKQLELFEMFFMKPGMNILCEWGDSTLLKRKNLINPSEIQFIENGSKKTFTPYNDITEALFVKKDLSFNDYCNKFSDIFLPERGKLSKILENTRKSLGCYDYAAGKVSEFSFTVQDDGTYDCMIEIFQSNQVSLALPKMPPTKKDAKIKGNPKKNITNDERIREAILSDFYIDPADKKAADLTPAIIKKECFNFIKKNSKQKDTFASGDAYISLRFIVKFLMNLTNVSDPNLPNDEDDFVFKLPKYKVDGKEQEFLPTHSSEYIISSNIDILYPNKNIVEVEINKNSDGSENVFRLKKGKEDGSINGYSFNSTTKNIEALQGEGFQIEFSKVTKDIGNALNIFVRYKKVVELFNGSETRGEFLTSILDLINKNSYGLFKLVIGPLEQDCNLSILDYKFAPQDIQDVLKSNPKYRFKPTTVNSIVKNFTYTFQMDNLIAGKMFFNSEAAVRSAFAKAEGELAKTPNDKNKKIPDIIPSSVDSFKSFDYSSFANQDGWYSINNVERQRQEKLWKKLKENKSSTVKTLSDATKTTKDPEPNYEQYLIDKSRFFNVTDKKSVRLVFEDPNIVRSEIGDINNITKSVVSNIDISITIDGFSGFRAGQCFNIDGIPEIYNQVGMFQIMNIKHNVTTEGWTTTIEASLRVGM